MVETSYSVMYLTAENQQDTVDHISIVQQIGRALLDNSHQNGWELSSGPVTTTEGEFAGYQFDILGSGDIDTSFFQQLVSGAMLQVHRNGESAQ